MFLCRFMIVAIALCAWTGAARADAIDITVPLNGWRNSTGSVERYTQDVHYPAVAVSTPEDQSAYAKIAGHIKTTPKTKDGSVGTLVVNGVALPQRIEADGSFSRPFIFGSGSNNVELRTADGARKRVQFYEAYQGKPQARLRIVLAWDTDGTDLDLHVISPDGFHTWYGNRAAPNGGALDVDVTTGYGPEIYSNAAPQPGVYLVYVNYYGGGGGDDRDDRDDSGDSGDGSGGSARAMTVAQVTVITGAGTLNEKKETVVVPMRRPGELVLAKRFVMP